MPELIRVGMADYKVGSAPATIISYGLGSCIGISIYDPQTKIGGLLHIMLPDSTQSRPSENPAKFADTGIPLMLADILQLGASRSGWWQNWLVVRRCLPLRMLRILCA